MVITEIGGTVGDIESLPFLEAIRQLKNDVGRENIMYIHVTLIPYIAASGELKTKPTQHSVKELRSIGIQPNVIVCRTDHSLSEDIKKKLALFCDIETEAVIENLNVDTLYDVPLMLQQQGLDDYVVKHLQLETPPAEMGEWTELVNKIKSLKHTTRIALVGKYVSLHDAYLSVAEALYHAGFNNNTEIEIEWIDAEMVTQENTNQLLKGMDGILVPGGFGDRGIEGKIATIQYARENQIPFFGICLGMQTAVIEFARNVVGLKDAHSSEFNIRTPYPVIDILPEQKDIEDLGGTMRLGLYPCKIESQTKAMEAYQDELVYERHRHRYEFNNEFREQLQEAGLKISGTSPDERLVEIVEIPSHPWFIATQFHPEFISRPNRPQPLFREFVKAALENRLKK